MPEIKKIIEVSVPHRISGFFEIVDQKNSGKTIKNPEKIGSRGAGFNLSAVGKTMVKVFKSPELEEKNYKIFINNNKLNKRAATSYYILKYVKDLIQNPIGIEIHHKFELPVGCGYGASGSGALGIILALNKALALNLDLFECGRIAHIAEVINRTGLGTVCGQLSGGLSILKNPGYPCHSERIQVDNNIKVVCTSFGEISTKSILSDPILNDKIKHAGKIALSKLINSPGIKTFMDVSLGFVRKTNILNLLDLNEIKQFLRDLNNQNIIGASMNQLGKSVYAVCKEKNLDKVKEIFQSYNSMDKIHILSINDKGPKIENFN